MASGTSGNATGLFLSGARETGDDVRVGNVRAVLAVSNIVKSSLGPTGLDKMLVDDIGDVIITNDGATILSQLDVEHPAAQLLVELAQLQDSEIGDGTTSVVLVAAELLRRSIEVLIQQHSIHPTTIISGYRTALKAAVSYVKKNLVVSMKDNNNNDSDKGGEEHRIDELLLQAAKTSMSSKIIGKESDFFARLVVDAVKSVKTRNKQYKKGGGGGGAGGKQAQQPPHRYPLSAIHIIKVHGKSTLDSYLMNGGYALVASRAAQGMPTLVEPKNDGDGSVKIAMLDMNLQRHRMAMGITVQVTDPAEVQKIHKHEMDLTKNKIDKIINAGAGVVLTTKGVDDVCLKYFVEAGVMCARRCNKDDLRRLAKATGGQVVVTMADMEGNESFDASALGTCARAQEVRVGDNEMIHFHGCRRRRRSEESGQQQEDDDDDDATGVSTIVLRGANEYMLDEMDRSVHDALCIIKRMLESGSLVPGGGAVETALSVYLHEHATTSDSVDTREQLAIHEFADALLIVPRTLANNAAKDSSDLIAKLTAVHARHQKTGKKNDDDGKEEGGGDHDESLRNYGLDLFAGDVRDNLSAGVVEPAVSKIKSLRFATEAAITILRIDDRITVSDQQQQG